MPSPIRALAMCGAALLLGAGPTPPPLTATLQALARDMTYGWAKTHPLEATALGLSDEDGRLDTPSVAQNAADLATIKSGKRGSPRFPGRTRRCTIGTMRRFCKHN